MQWFLYTLGLFEYDRFAELDRRSTLSAGPGYQFFESEDSEEKWDAKPMMLFGWQFDQ